MNFGCLDGSHTISIKTYNLLLITLDGLPDQKIYFFKKKCKISLLLSTTPNTLKIHTDSPGRNLWSIEKVDLFVFIRLFVVLKNGNENTFVYTKTISRYFL